MEFTEDAAFGGETPEPERPAPAGPVDAGALAQETTALAGTRSLASTQTPVRGAVSRAVEEVVSWFKTLASAAVYATLIVTFVGQVARVDGSSMLPTLHDQDRLIVNKLAYEWHRPQIGDIVMV